MISPAYDEEREAVKNCQDGDHAVVIRRKLFIYTVIFSAGISAGFFIFEKARLAGGSLVMLSCAMVICLAAGRDTRLRRKLIAWLAAGFLVFTCRYLYYGTAFMPHGSISVENVVLIDGFAESASIADGKLRLILSDVCLGCRSAEDDEKGEDAEQLEAGIRNGIRVLVNVYEAEDYDPAAFIGRRIRAYGKLKEAPSADNPGCFDYRIYLRSKGIGYLFTARSLDTCEDEMAPRSEKIGIYGKYRRALYLTRERFLDMFTDPDTRSFIKGTVFGDKSDIDEEVRDEFSMNGTGHILAVSGLHTGFLYALLRVITGKRRSIASVVVTVTVLFLYGEMTMWSPSAMRAVTVLTVSLMSIYVRRLFDLLSSVSAAALIILVREPYQLFSTGFQMSFIALLGISFLAGPLAVFIGEWLAVPIAVQAAVLPLTGFVFHRINVLSVFINIPVIFMASVLVPACMTALMISLISGTVPKLMITVIEGLTDIIVRFNSFTSAGGFFSGLVTSAGAGFILLLYLSLLLISSEWFRVTLLRHEYRKAACAAVCILALSLCAGAASYNPFADDEIVFVSVGQGDCTHVRAGGKDVLIDGGGDTERNIGKDVLMPYLLSNGAERAELGLVTHLHTDHYLGLAQLSDVYPVGAIGIPSDYRMAVENQLSQSGPGYVLPDRIEFLEQGMRIMITDDVYIEPIWPLKGSRGEIDIDDPNENNMVYLIFYDGVKIMVTGDLLEEDELEMINYYRSTDVLDCDILKVAHHGSKSSSSEEFLDAVSPQIAVIQVGKNNFYGHPHQQTLDRLEDRGIKVYRTDLNGAVGIDFRKQITLSKQGSAFVRSFKVDLQKDSK